MGRWKDRLLDGGSPAAASAPAPREAGRPDLADIAASLGLRRAGREWTGPCPACGGVDRFRLTAEGRAFCRHCCPDGRDAAAVRRLRLAAGLERPGDGRRGAAGARGRTSGGQGTRTAWNGRPGPDAGDSRASRGQTAGQPDTGAARIDLARRIWAAARPADGTLARLYLATRQAWPPDGCGPDLPAAVRWLPRERAPSREGTWPGLPAGSAGAILYGFATGAGKSATVADLVAVNAEAMDPAGRRLAPRWRRTIGARGGALFAAGGPGPAIVLAEGEVSALACRALHPGARCFGTGGEGGMRAIEADMLPAARGAVLIETDGDRQGRDAARAARLALPGADVTWRRDGAGDPADDIAEAVAERVAIATEAGAGEAEALATAWRDMHDTHGEDPKSEPSGPAPARSPRAAGAHHAPDA